MRTSSFGEVNCRVNSRSEVPINYYRVWMKILELMLYKPSVNTSCPRCGERAKTMDHLFRECPVIVEVWTTLSL
ncbi:hypothetical protein Gotur_005883, partial [Gossypium turneri]